VAGAGNIKLKWRSKSNEMSIAKLVRAVSNPQHLLAMWGSDPGAQSLFSLKGVGYADDFIRDLLIAQDMFGNTPLPTTQLALLVREEPCRDGLMFGSEISDFQYLLNYACVGSGFLDLSLLVASFTSRRQHLLRFYKSSVPGIDTMGIRMRRHKTPEFDAACAFHRSSGPSTERFGDVLEKVRLLKNHEATHPRHGAPYKAAELLLSKIKPRVLTKHAKAIAELMVALANHNEAESHAKSKGPLLELRWSYRFIVMARCADICQPIQVERWMYSAEVCGKPCASAMTALRVYARES
jgi:hypothetical protein